MTECPVIHGSENGKNIPDSYRCGNTVLFVERYDSVSASSIMVGFACGGGSAVKTLYFENTLTEQCSECSCFEIIMPVKRVKYKCR